VSSWISEARVQRGWSQTDLAARLGISRQTIAAIEAGRYHPSVDLSEQIGEACGLDVPSLQELELTRQVHERLGGSSEPCSATLECAGASLAARSVAGDSWSFFPLDSGRSVVTLGDVSGKGLAAALMMASLQGGLRSLYASGQREPRRILEAINKALWASTAADHFATLFLGHYSESDRRLTYVNCGHQPPLLLRANGSIERLEPTATVLGLFPQWSCELSEVSLRPLDLLLLFSDGVTEACGLDGERFEEARLIELLGRQRHLPAASVAAGVRDAVLAFSQGRLSDDLTVVALRPRCGTYPLS
jgi:sigma-B regulation protein RsbU (phosphoserine phosphatase)